MYEKVLKKLEFDKVRELLAARAASSLGKERCRMLEPQTDRWLIERLQEETEEALTMLSRKGAPPFGPLRDIRPVLKRTSVEGVLSMGELLMISDTLRSIRSVQYYGRQEESEAPARPMLDPLFAGLSSFPDIQREIERCILSEEEMDDHASEALASIRRQIAAAEQRVRSELNQMIHSASYKGALQDPVVALRGGRYCLPVKAEFRASIKGLVHDQSGSGSTVFVEPMVVVQLNNKVSELQLEEKAEIERILRMLSGRVSAVQNELVTDIELMTQLDFIFAKAKLALDQDAVRPRFSDDRRIDLPAARHPLIDRAQVVPIHVMLGGDFTTLVITGPNTGGKTVTLKTLGLLTLMGQAGLFIPASSRSCLTVVDQVFADIGDEQSIEQSLSTFSSHMVNIVEILQKMTGQSLVLFDELGAGTDPVEGAALANAILENLRERRILTAATTHYSELKVYALSTEGVENASCEFDVETLKPTYRLLIGVPGKSNAFAIASRLGLSEQVIEKAGEYLESNDIKFEEMMTDLEIRRLQTEKEQQRVEELRKEVSRLEEETRSRQAALEKKQETILREAREEAREILRKAKQEADETISQMNKAIRDGAKVDMRKLEESRARLRKGASEMEKDMEAAADKRRAAVDPSRLVKGALVRLATIDADCIILEPPDARGNMKVQAGILQMRVRAADVAAILTDDGKKPLPATKAKEKNEDRGVRAGSFGKSLGIATEVDVRGMNTEEALSAVDKYLDDAYLAGLEKVTIIHGKGTGVLRKEVQNFLRRRPQIKSYRLGTYGEGENGVTIVELKK
ncbi:MAG: endonuclease MutS2 [Firmicutes bacterium]|nr:endonuclease MutS2 [Bacillota bacterium]